MLVGTEVAPATDGADDRSDPAEPELRDPELEAQIDPDPVGDDTVEPLNAAEVDINDLLGSRRRSRPSGWPGACRLRAGV